MATPFLGEIKIVSFGFPMKGWALCSGQLLPISQFQALFSILGTTYGGDGRVNFGLPDLQGRSPIHTGAGFTLGQLGGEQDHTIVVSELPSHTHVVGISSAGADASSPAGAIEASAVTTNFAPPGTAAALDPIAFTAAGGGQAHHNMSPYLVLSFVIALQGLFPTQN
jgi:microcystin-dependent protein